MRDTNAMRLAVVFTTAMIASACTDSSLKRSDANALLVEAYPQGTEEKHMELCLGSKRKAKIKTTKIFWGHPCEKSYPAEVYQKIFIKKYPLVSIEQFKHKACDHFSCQDRIINVISGVDGEELKRLNAEEFMWVDDGKIKIKMYDYEVDQITGIRQNDDGSIIPDTKCNAVVEYTYKRYNKAPWADEYLQRIKKPPKIYSACFVKYDDGWRIKT